MSKNKFILKSLHVYYCDWGEKKGTYSGQAEFLDQEDITNFTFKLEDLETKEMLKVISKAVGERALNLAKELKNI